VRFRQYANIKTNKRSVKMAHCIVLFVLTAVAVPGTDAVVLQEPPRKMKYSITIPARPVCAPKGGTCPNQLNMLRCAMRPHSTDVHPEMKVMEMPSNGMVNTGLGPSYAQNVRYLLFDADDTSGFAGVKCTVQSAMSCKRGAVDTTKKCGDSQCVPDVRNPFLEYVRMQLGGAIGALAVSKGHVRPSSAAVVGIGAGSLPSWLLAAFPGVTVDAVDIDASVVTIATDCFGLPERESRLKTHIEDGMHFMQGNGRFEEYDMVMLDVVPLPKPFRAMISAAHDRLAVDGILAVNGWKPDKEFQGLQKDAMTVFSRVWLAEDDQGGNQILLAVKGGAGLRETMPNMNELEAMGAPKDAATWSSQYTWKKLV
jgi:hypothetical protein